MTVSVALASYNGAAYIEEQLRSVLVQLGPDDEVVVSDDGSSDGTREQLARLAAADGRIRIIDGPKEGVVHNFEHALSHCRGDVIFLCDQDDIWRPGKVQKALAVMEDKQTLLVLHDAQVVDSGGKLLSPSFFEMRGCRSGYWRNLMKNSFIGCCMAFKRELLQTALPFPRDIPMHDQWLGLLAEKKHGVRLIREPLLSYRRHGGNVTGDKHGSLWRMMQSRLVMMRELRKRKG